MNDDIARLIATIDDSPDPSHGDLTPSVQSDNQWTRLRAQRVLERATRAWVRERTPERPMTRKADYAWVELWQRNGNYDWEAPAEARTAAVARWQSWLADKQ